MNWSALFLMTAGLTAPEITLPELQMQFDSYTQAYQTAGETHKPMFVVLNPPVTEVANREPISIEELRKDPKIGTLLEKYVVVVVDTGTEHGKQVHERFGSKPLPYIAVIDEKQKKQVYRTSEGVLKPQLEKVLTQYQDGVKAALEAQVKAYPNCPKCQKALFEF
jgi:hypothetical protein